MAEQKNVLSPMGFNVPIPTPDTLPVTRTPTGILEDQLREQISLAPVSSFIDENNQIVLGQPKEIDLYELFTGNYSDSDGDFTDTPLNLNQIARLVVDQQGLPSGLSLIHI